MLADFNSNFNETVEEKESEDLEGNEDAFMWLRIVKSVSDLTNDSMANCWEYSIQEFFTYLLFNRKLNIERREQLNKIKQ